MPPEQWPDCDPRFVFRCPRCGSDTIKMPILKAPKGYVFDSTLVLVTCFHCERQSKLSDVTVIVDA